MKSRHQRWLITMLATLLGGGVFAGCGEENGWEHPNRELHAAPPEATNDTMSVAELESAWRAQDQEAARAARAASRQQNAPRADRPEENWPDASGSGLLEAAIEYLAGVLQGDGERTVDKPAARGQRDAVGGGPLPSAPSPSPEGSGTM